MDKMSEILTKIEIITRPDKFDELKGELTKVGITGMTVSNVLGAGMSKGTTEVYRGKSVPMDLTHKIKIEIVVCDVPVKTVVDTVKKVCQTGRYGDGKIFTYELSNAIKVRTGEEGRDALQYDN
jgi:nitrogen regulatory protein P-II 1